MEAGTDERLAKMNAHMDAARRLRRGVREFPEARGALLKCLRHHMAGAATLASEICAGAGESQAPVAVVT